MDKIEITIGIDIGGTNTAYGFVDQSGKIIYESSIPTIAEKEAEQLFGTDGNIIGIWYLLVSSCASDLSDHVFS